ncbi:hypothetical protein K435DRAFT_964919 [Dendrothele bispora CBS 962.96]|uniref:Uncharacterized protein n=1 Tax=Dendrothele bispora (strain CBS 962.96) TaxID=1314807 RepID=A0A4S8M807_DENBC|nr:hypothetical protein K435DRAFT_964919 [Dendrothele bispora CBS 962.96]
MEIPVARTSKKILPVRSRLRTSWRRSKDLIDLEAHSDDDEDPGGSSATRVRDFIIDHNEGDEGYWNHPGFGIHSNSQDSSSIKKRRVVHNGRTRRFTGYRKDDSDNEDDESSRGHPPESSDDFGCAISRLTMEDQQLWKFECEVCNLSFSSSSPAHKIAYIPPHIRQQDQEIRVANTLQLICPLQKVSFKTYKSDPGWVYVSGVRPSSEFEKWILHSTTSVLKDFSNTLYQSPASLRYEVVDYDPAYLPRPSQSLDNLGLLPTLVNTFVTITSGKSKGEIAFVYTSGTRSMGVTEVMTLSVPRIPVSMDASDLDDHDPPNPVPSSRASPAPGDSSTSSSSSSASRDREKRVNESLYSERSSPSLFDSSQAHPTGSSGADTHRRTQRSITQTIHNEEYQHGLLVKQFRVDQLQAIDTIPYDLMKRFMESGHPAIPTDLHYPTIKEWLFEEGDRVRSLSCGSVGIVQKRLSVLVEVDFGTSSIGHYISAGPVPLVGQHYLSRWELVKEFMKGDFVTSTWTDPRKQFSGWVVACEAPSATDHRFHASFNVLVIAQPERGHISSKELFTVHRNMLRRQRWSEIRGCGQPYHFPLGSSIGHPWIGVRVLITCPRHPKLLGKRGAIKDVILSQSLNRYRRQSLLQVKLEICVDGDHRLWPRETIDYYGVVEEGSCRLVHEVHPLDPVPCTVPWRGVSVRILRHPSDKGKYATVLDVVPVPLSETLNTVTTTRSNRTCSYPSGLKITVQLAAYSDKRTNATLELDYYSLAAVDKNTGTLKYLHDVCRLNAAQSAHFRPRSTLEAHKLDQRIPAGGSIPLLDYTHNAPVSAQLQQTVLTSARGDTNGSLSRPLPPPVLAQVSQTASNSSEGDATSTSFGLTRTLFMFPHVPSVGSSGTAVTTSTSPSLASLYSWYSGVSCKSHPSFASLPSADMSGQCKPDSPSSYSQGSAVSLGLFNSDWILDERLVGKKMTVTPHSGRWRDRDICVVSTRRGDGKIEIARIHYKKRCTFDPGLIFPKKPNYARDNGLLVVIKGEHTGKFVRRIHHTLKREMLVKVVHHAEGNEDHLTSEELRLKPDVLCLAFESLDDRMRNRDVMREQRIRFIKADGKPQTLRTLVDAGNRNVFYQSSDYDTSRDDTEQRPRRRNSNNNTDSSDTHHNADNSRPNFASEGSPIGPSRNYDEIKSYTEQDGRNIQGRNIENHGTYNENRVQGDWQTILTTGGVMTSAFWTGRTTVQLEGSYYIQQGQLQLPTNNAITVIYPQYSFDQLPSLALSVIVLHRVLIHFLTFARHYFDSARQLA